ncbi:FMN-binding protein [bacterium]|jgi:Na+-translocating ferredoxin:NAD+ oxidoreductase RnfG subunit|nr:FMN-binding protein [Gammaproteobacteria bacterium]MCH1551435.1 FMN-binding protein [Pseudomonadales bacterium]MDB3937037.1 FMN-binding protein [bacterium]
MLRRALSLCLIGGLCGILLVGTYIFTAEPIRLNREANARALAAQMLGAPIPADINIENPIYGSCANWLFQHITTNGYAGDIGWLVLWEREKNTMTIRVTDHRETPGIGDFIDHTRDQWITKNDGMEPLAHANIDNVSGATVTTNALRAAATAASVNFKRFCE